ncbi:MAG TPA: glycosyltransferase family 4 protein [Stellaceae bacterium]|nr:glycosyltransferase family 4 protein [Stellaceae bacterium]
MIYLFIHQWFPGQYQHLARYLADQPDNEVFFITKANPNFMRGVTKLNYKMDAPAQLICHQFSLDLDIGIRTGMAVAQECQNLKDKGIIPDIIIGHNGWGETMFVKDVFPDVPLTAYFEFFYRAYGLDVDFDPEYPPLPSDPFMLRCRNAVNHIGFNAADWGHTATEWQRSLYPVEMQTRITAIHEGVSTERVKPDPEAWVQLARSDRTLTRKDEVITYVARNLEPYRGFHVFMRTLPELQRRRPNAQVIIIGGDGVSYGRHPDGGTTYREILLKEVGSQLDFSRIHFLGQVDYAAYVNVLQVSSVHVYLTYPFVLSWSFIEAMAAGCLIVGSDTPPVMEVLQDGVNGLAVDFFATSRICDRIEEVLDHPDRMADIREAARRTAVTKYDLSVTLPRWCQLIDDVRGGRRPSLSLAAE